MNARESPFGCFKIHTKNDNQSTVRANMTLKSRAAHCDTSMMKQVIKAVQLMPKKSRTENCF